MVDLDKRLITRNVKPVNLTPSIPPALTSSVPTLPNTVKTNRITATGLLSGDVGKGRTRAWSVEGTYIEACNCEVACLAFSSHHQRRVNAKSWSDGILTRVIMATPFSMV